MADEKTAQDKDPFANFQTESYDRGELVVDEPAGEPAEPSEEVEEQSEGGGSAEPTAQGGEPQPVAKEGEQPPKKKQSVQERINDLTRARREAERLAEAEKVRADRVEAELRQLRQTPPPKAEEKPPVEADDPNAPKPEDFEYGELDSRYIRALASHEADKRFAELRKQDQDVQQSREQEERQVKARESFDKMLDYGAQKHDDFYQKVVIDSEEGRWPLSETLGGLLLGSDVGGDIAYHLASNPQEAEQVYKTSPVEQARYFGRMEAKFSAGQSAAPGVEPGKPAPKTPKAPAPIEHARGAGGQFQATADTDDFEAFEARVNSKGK